MKTKRVTRYYAECGKGFWKKTAALYHEDSCKCWTNPKNKACKTCKHGEFQPYESDTGQEAFWDCYQPDHNDEHSGAPRDIKYISVNCVLHEQETLRN